MIAQRDICYGRFRSNPYIPELLPNDFIFLEDFLSGFRVAF